MIWHILYLLNKLRWKICNLIIKQFLKNDENRFKDFKKCQKECIWCKRIYNDSSKHIYKYLCSKKCAKLYIAEKNQIFKGNNRCSKHKFQRLTYKNICWSCYISDIKCKSTPKIKKRLLLRLNGFKVIPTFRTSKETWNGDKIAFEQFLNDNGVKWFVYIKFYEEKLGRNSKQRIKPIVAGKSGSMKVNYSGSDLSFSTDVRYGISKQFLHYNKVNWHYDHIMIKKCRSESQAYQIESKIINKFDLYGS